MPPSSIMGRRRRTEKWCYESGVHAAAKCLRQDYDIDSIWTCRHSPLCVALPIWIDRIGHRVQIVVPPPRHTAARCC